MRFVIVSLVTICVGFSVHATEVPSEFQNPYKYIGKSVSSVSRTLSTKPNEGNNIVIEKSDYEYFFETNNNKVTFADVRFIKTAPCSQTDDFDSEVLLKKLAINSNDVELVRKRSHFHTYYDHRNKLKIGVSCLYNGAPLNVSFSRKYYGN